MGMGMGMNEENLPPLFPFPDSINGVHIPRRKSCRVESKHEEDGDSISMLEAATILIEMSNGGYRKDENKTKRKRKTPRTKKQRKKLRQEEIELAKNPPEMPAAMRDRIAEKGGYEIQLVIQKQLEETDVNKNHGRLSLPLHKVRREFVREEERKVLEEENGKKKKNGMEVGIMDSLLQESSMMLKKWKIGSGPVYCLMNNWNSFVAQSGLKSGDYIQLWSFRNNNSHILSFAIVKLNISNYV